MRRCALLRMPLRPTSPGSLEQSHSAPSDRSTGPLAAFEKKSLPLPLCFYCWGRGQIFRMGPAVESPLTNVDTISLHGALVRIPRHVAGMSLALHPTAAPAWLTALHSLASAARLVDERDLASKLQGLASNTPATHGGKTPAGL
jgi:hypothetical protein